MMVRPPFKPEIKPRVGTVHTGAADIPKIVPDDLLAVRKQEDDGRMLSR